MGPDIFPRRHTEQKVAVEDTGDSGTAQPVNKEDGGTLGPLRWRRSPWVYQLLVWWSSPDVLYLMSVLLPGPVPVLWMLP